MFIDLGPSQSNLNKSAVLCCDYILPPVNAGLYSCVSVHGLLTSVLKGKSGWLASHKRMVDIQYSDEFVSSYPSVLEWRLPLNPPVLLPFLVSNYALEKKGKGAKKEVEGTLFHSSTQFVNTMTQFINEDEFDGPVKVLYKRNGGRMVIPFLCSLDAMSACEELGRPLVEVTRKHLVDYWQNDLKKKRSNAKLEKLKECPHFEEEVAVGKERYLSLAEWIIQLVDEKNSKA
jgi:cellulose biosynthesis protein BcsQ